MRAGDALSRREFLLPLAAAGAVRRLPAAESRRRIAPEDEIRLGSDGLLRSAAGRLYFALGGFHANVLPLARLELSEAEMERVRPYIWSAQKTDG